MGRDRGESAQLADAIVEVTKLVRPYGPIGCASSIRLESAPCSSPIEALSPILEAREDSNLVLLLTGAIAAYTKVGIMLTFAGASAAVLGVLPALRIDVSTLTIRVDRREYDHR